MKIFDEAIVEAGHHRLASAVSAETEVLAASVDLLSKSLLHQNSIKLTDEMRAGYLAISQLGFRIVNDVAAATKLLDSGYFVQAAAINRDLAEIGMLALYFAEEPEQLLEWWSAREQRYKKFGRSSLRSKVRNQARFDYLNGYFDTFSEYGTHPSSLSVFGHMDGVYLHPGPHINKKLYIDTFKDLAVLTWHVTDAGGDVYARVFRIPVADLFPQETQRFIESWNGIAPALGSP